MDKSVTLRANMGDNQPAVCIALEGNGSRPSHRGGGYSEDGGMFTLNTIEKHGVCYAIDQQGGKGGANWLKDKMCTICSDSHGTPHAVCYGISAYESNAMKSNNPHSGIYEANTSRTLDLNGGNPACNQGGMLIVERKSELPG